MRILIVEDEPVHARFLTTHLRKMLGKTIESIQTQKTLTAAECFLLDESVDLLFLDLNLYGESGFDLLERMHASDFLTIIVSAHTELALRAFDYGVLDFVPKPIMEDRLKQAIDRYLNKSFRVSRSFFSYYNEGTIERIPLEEIRYFSAEGKRLLIHCKDGRVRTCYRQIGQVERVLPDRYKRIHRSHIVDLHQIRQLQSYSGGRCEILLQDDTVLPVSRSLAAGLRQSLFEAQSFG